MTGRRLTALVLAGERAPGDPVAALCGERWKCMVPVDGTPMLARVVAALAGSDQVGTIALSLPDLQLMERLPDLRALVDSGRVRALPTAPSPCLSVKAALDSLMQPFPLLVTTADHALLDTALVEMFIERAQSMTGDLAVGLVPRHIIRAAYPQSRRTYMRFRDGGFSGANLFILSRPASRRAVDFWHKVERERKRPWRIARKLGVASSLLFVLRLLTLKQALRRASRRIGAEAEGILLPVPEAAIDVDKPDDLTLVEAILAERGRRGRPMPLAHEPQAS